MNNRHDHNCPWKNWDTIWANGTWWGRHKYLLVENCHRELLPTCWRTRRVPWNGSELGRVYHLISSLRWIHSNGPWLLPEDASGYLKLINELIMTSYGNYSSLAWTYVLLIFLSLVVRNTMLPLTTSPLKYTPFLLFRRNLHLDGIL